jgi:hypothetical protein
MISDPLVVVCDVARMQMMRGQPRILIEDSQK